MKKKSKKTKKAGKRHPARRKPARRFSAKATRHVPAKGKARRAAGFVPPLRSPEIQKFRELLTQKRDELLAIVQRKKEQELQETSEVGDEADIATQSVEKEILFELTDVEKQTLDKVEAALLKMEKGVYGVCESCQRPILRMRLGIMPWARYCVNCQAEQDVPPSE